jgi:hypothetical protein
VTSTLARWVLSGRGEATGDRAGYHFDDGESPTYVNTESALWCTIRHYAELHKVDKDHLADTLLIVGRRGEPVTADGIWRTAQALALHVAG